MGYITPESETVDQVAWTLFSFKKNLIKRVESPNGEMFGGMYFADSIGSGIVSSTHRFNLEVSQTYSGAYRELLVLLDRRYEKNRDRDSSVVTAELSGTYTLPELKPELPDAQPKPGTFPQV